MLRDFVKEGGIYSLSGIITKGIGILLIPFYTKIFSTGDYGMLDLITVFGSMINIIFPLEITHGVARNIADSNEPEQKKILYSSTGLIYTLIAYGLFFILATIFSSQILGSYLFNETKITPIIFTMACLSIALNGIFYFFLHQLKWIRKVKTHSILSIFHSLITISLTILFVLIFDQGIIGVFYATIISTPIFIGLSYFYSKECFAFKFSKTLFYKMLSYSVPIVFQSLSLIILIYADKVIIKDIKSVSETGIYGIAYRVASITQIIFTGFSYSLAPLIYANYANKESNQKLARLFDYFVIMSFSGTLLVSLFSLEFLTIFTQENYYQAYLIIPILCLVTLTGGFQMFFHGLSIAKKTTKLAFINIFCATINIGLNFLLIPIWGGSGAAVATLISTLINLFILAYVSQKEYKIPLRFPKLIFPALLLFIIIGCYLFLEKEITLVSILLKTGTIIIFVFILIKIFDKENLIRSNSIKLLSRIRMKKQS